jgi:phage gp29-like protein
MGRDDRITGVLSTRTKGLLGLPIDIEDADSAAAKALKEQRPKMLPTAQVRKLLRSGIMLGIGVGQNVWTRTETTWSPRLKWWHPQFIQWRWDTRSYWIQTMDGLLELHAGDGEWVLYTPYGEQLGYLDALVRALAIPWLIRQWARRDWARYSEVHGLPIRKGKVPSAGRRRGQGAIHHRALAARLRKRHPAAAGHRGRRELRRRDARGELAELGRLPGAAAEDRHRHRGRALGQNLTTEAGTGTGKGALSTATIHNQIRQDVLQDDATTLADCLHEQTVRPWALYNYGDEEAAPYATFHTDPPEDLGAKATSYQTVANALTAFKGVRAPVDVGQVLVDFGIPVVQGKPMPDLTEEPEPEPGDDGKPGDKPGKDKPK